jgi:hypothetical protein
VFCSWLYEYCWLGMTRYTWSTPLLPSWCRCDLDSPFLSWVMCHKHGHSAFNLHQKTAEGSDPFLWAEGVPGDEMHRRKSVQYGNSVMSQQIVCEWIERFKKDRTSVKHGEGTGRQSTSVTDADAERVYGIILQNRRVTADEVAHQLQIIRGSLVQPMKLSTTGLPSTKSVRDGSKSNSRNCTKRNSPCPHTAVHTVETLNDTLKYWSIPCIVLTLPLRTHLFGPLQQAFRGRRFTTDQQLHVTVHVWLVCQPEIFILRAYSRLCGDGQSAL